MLGLCLLGQALLYLLAGSRRHDNPIYRLFDLLTRPPRALLGRLIGKPADRAIVGVLTFGILLVNWITLAIMRKFV